MPYITERATIFKYTLPDRYEPAYDEEPEEEEEEEEEE